MKKVQVISRTPFRFPLGGGSTDLPSYCSKFGGFIFGVAVEMYMDIIFRRPWVGISDMVEIQYLRFEAVRNINELKHDIAREALRLTETTHSIQIYFHADTPMGTGLGSSGSCSVGLLNGLWYLKGVARNQIQLAEEAFEITQRLGKPDGKQDPYLAALGGFVVLEIDIDQRVTVIRPPILPATVEKFLNNISIFFSGVRRESVDVLRDQDQAKAVALKHRTKAIGQQILRAFILGSLDDFGHLMHEHWEVKREMSDKITSSELDSLYELAIKNGALGGKLMGAGGGGYFMFYSHDEGERERLCRAMASRGFRRVEFSIDYTGTRVQELTL